MASILKPKSFFGSKPSVDSQPSTGAVAPGGAKENTGDPSSTASEHRSLDSVTAQARAILQQCQIDCEQLRVKARKEAIEEGRWLVSMRFAMPWNQPPSSGCDSGSTKRYHLRSKSRRSFWFARLKAIQQFCLLGSRKWYVWSNPNDTLRSNSIQPMR
jgi:anti-sigma28 factor (negative regulator of flagellin synthesis)